MRSFTRHAYVPAWIMRHVTNYDTRVSLGYAKPEWPSKQSKPKPVTDQSRPHKSIYT
jgi:hypothetical protein